jgi:uncharacterized membrane protein YfcA
VIAATIVLAVLVGVSLGLLGGGGSILTVPILLYVTGLQPRSAITTSLFVVGTTSLVGTIFHARQSRVRFQMGVAFGLASMVGAYAGGRVAHYLPDSVLLGGFTLMMSVTAVAMLRKRTITSALDLEELELDGAALVRAAATGVGLGIVTGIVGVGGGFVIVPALLALGLPMRSAVGTSLMIIAMNSFAGLLGAIGHVDVPWTLALEITGAAVCGSLVGATLAGRIAPESLRRAFGWFVLAAAALMIERQIRHPIEKR